MIWLLAIVLVVSVITGCESEPEFNYNSKAKRDFATLPGKIGFTIEMPPDVLHYVIEKGELVKVDSLPKAPREAKAISGYIRATGLPPQKDYDYIGPYLGSPDKRYVAASITGRRSEMPNGFVIVETETNKIIAVNIGDEIRYMIGLAWSPDSKWIAVLKDSGRLGWGPLDILGRLLGHPPVYRTYYLEVANLAGDVLAHSKLIWETRDSWGWVVWLE